MTPKEQINELNIVLYGIGTRLGINRRRNPEISLNRWGNFDSNNMYMFQFGNTRWYGNNRLVLVYKGMCIGLYNYVRLRHFR